MGDECILAHDLGTSGNKAVLTDVAGAIKATAVRGYDVRYTSGGGAEQDPQAWWLAVLESSRQVLEKAGVAPSQVAAVSISSQMVGTLPVTSMGEPLRWAMIWLDHRAEEEAIWIREATGLDFITAKDCSSKILWIMRHEPGIYSRTALVLDCKDFIIHKMTGEFATDWSAASATTLFDPVNHVWWPQVYSAIGLPAEKLPLAVPSTEIVGRLTREAATQMGLIEGVPVVCGGGDVPCAVIGSGAVSAGRGHLYLGTSAWIVVPTPTFLLPEAGLGMCCGNDPGMYNLVGEMDNAGGCLQWFGKTVLSGEEREEAKRRGISRYQLMDQLAAEVDAGSEGLIFLPWMWGERAPVNDDKVRGGFAGLALNHTKGHMVRAVLEGVGYHIRWILGGFDSVGFPQSRVNVIGGGALSPTWLQILADITGVRMVQVDRPLDACARGAALTASVGIGALPNLGEVERLVGIGAEYVPNQEHCDAYSRGYASFRHLYGPLSDIGNDRVPAQ